MGIETKPKNQCEKERKDEKKNKKKEDNLSPETQWKQMEKEKMKKNCNSSKVVEENPVNGDEI